MVAQVECVPKACGPCMQLFMQDLGSFGQGDWSPFSGSDPWGRLYGNECSARTETMAAIRMRTDCCATVMAMQSS
jgi:hypothetical protein